MATTTPNIQSKGLLRSTALVSSMTMLSRLMGFARDMINAHIFGAVAGMDAFLIAFKIPNFMRRLFAEGAFSQAFVPVLSEYQTQNSEEDVREFLGDMAGTLSTVLFVLTLVAVIATPILIRLFAPGFDPDSSRFALAAYMLKITFPYLMLISLTGMAGGVLNTYGRFGVPAFTPVLLNVSMISAALFLAPYFEEPIVALAWGVLAAGIIQLLFQFPFLYRAGFLVRPRWNFSDPGVVRVLKLMVPALFGVSVAQVNLLIDTIFASFLPVGSVSWLYYSDRLTNFPLGVFGVAVATVILPHLSRKHAEHSSEQYSRSVDWGIRLILLIALPSAIGLYCLAGPLLASLLGYGAFGPHDVAMARLSLMAFAVGVPGFMLIKVLASGFYARQNIKTPVKVAAFAMLINTILCFLLIGPMAHAGLALASALAGMVNASALLALLWRRGHYQPSAGWRNFAFQLLVANTVLILCLRLFAHPLSDWLAWAALARAGHLSLTVFSAIGSYFLALYLCGLRLSHIRLKGQA